MNRCKKYNLDDFRQLLIVEEVVVDRIFSPFLLLLLLSLCHAENVYRRMLRFFSSRELFFDSFN